MKTIKMIVTAIFICSICVLPGCKKDVAPSGQTTYNNFSSLGGLKFHVKTNAGMDIPNATVGIALSQADLVTNTYLASRITDSKGNADFGKLNSGNYYYEADVTIGSTRYHGEGIVQVQAGIDLVQELTVQ